jgi:hypothetical protein
VIEHFWEGYEGISREMARVIAPGGYLFLTFPSMSWLRTTKARLGMYEPWTGTSQQPQDFYQFVFDRKQVQRSIETQGFRLRRALPLDGVKGLKDETRLFKRGLTWLYNYRGNSRLVRRGHFVITNTLSWVAGHMSLLIFELVH